MVVTQGVLLSWLASFYMDAGYLDKLISHPESAFTLTIKVVPENNITKTFDYMKDYAYKHGVFYIRNDFIANKNNSVRGLSIGVDGDYEKIKIRLNFRIWDRI